MKIKKGNKLLVGILSLSAFSMVFSGGLMKVDAAKSDDNDHNQKHLDSQENDHDGNEKDNDDKDEDNKDKGHIDKDDKNKNKSNSNVKKVTAKPVATSPSIVKKTTTIAPKKVTLTQPSVVTQSTTTTRPT